MLLAKKTTEKTDSEAVFKWELNRVIVNVCQIGESPRRSMDYIKAPKPSIIPIMEQQARRYV